MKKIIETLKLKWAEYLLEVFVIIIGILGAFSLNAWNESRKENDRERKLLIELISNLETNIETLESSKESNREAIKGTDMILHHFQNSTAGDSLRLFFNANVPLETVNLSYSTFESIKSVGFDILKNDEIRLSTIDLFEVIYPHHVRTVHEVSPTFYESFNNWSMLNRHKINQILSSPEQRNDDSYIFISNYLAGKKVWKTAIITGHNEILEPTIELKKLIENYLDKND